MNVTLPPYLYKYHSLSKQFPETIESGGVLRQKNGFDALEDMLINGRIYFSKPTNFNDPFELRGVHISLSARERENITNRTVLQMRRNRPPGLSAAEVSRIVREQARRQQSEIEQELEQSGDSLLHRTGYISFSASNEVPLLWAHYADGHKGLCLRFNCNTDSFFLENRAGRVMQVAYGDEILHKEVERDSGEAFLLKASRKASCWTYEEEFRVYKTPTNHRADDAQGNHPFDSAIVDGIFLGLRLPDEHREQVIAVAKTARHEISIFQAQMHPDQLKIIFAAVDLA